ncbi:MAG: CBS domain-containing protein, partial [Rickettsiales bacterium]|nr:CBS domain-containing protein [Rickettsiales bacterium]
SLGCVGVVNKDQQIIGIITDGDLRRHINSGIMNMKAYEVMTSNPITVNSECLSAKALSIMEDKAITTLFILDDNHHPQGIIHIHDILRAGIA